MRIGNYETHPACDAFPLLDDSSAQALADDIRTNGLAEPVVLLNGRILDGRNRLLACARAGVAPRFVNWAGTGSPTAWVVSVNLHRRHLTESQRAMVGARVKPLFEGEARARMAQGGRGGLALQGVASLPQVEPRKARDEAAAAVNVSPRSVQSAARVIDSGAPELIAKVDAGRVSVSAAAEVATLPKPEQAAIVADGPDRVALVAKEIREARKPHVAQNSGNNEWYTPQAYIDAARRVMGGIDLDPASSPAANAVVGAARFYTAEDDGCACPWAGRVWLNPPYSRDQVERFADKLAESVAAIDAAIVLVNNGTETKWFARMISAASAVAFPTGRVKFWGPNGEKGLPLQGQAFIYIGPMPDLFCAEFASFGWVAKL